MRKFLTLFAAIMIVAGVTNRGLAQVVTDVKPNAANAQILGAIALTATQALEFGGIVPNATTAGTVTIDNADGRTNTVVTLVTGGRVTAKSAAYTVAGTGDVPYSIVIPTASFDLLNTTTGVAADKMAVTDMTCSYTTKVSTFSHTGTDAFKVGGKLNVLAAQVPGIYTANFNVTVAY
jgi:hypothetical protein